MPHILVLRAPTATHRRAQSPDCRWGSADPQSVYRGARSGSPSACFTNWTLDQHFIGGQPAPGNGVWVDGHIRAERTRSSAKNHILLAIRDRPTQVLQDPNRWRVPSGPLPTPTWLNLGTCCPSRGRRTRLAQPPCSLTYAIIWSCSGEGRAMLDPPHRARVPRGHHDSRTPPDRLCWRRGRQGWPQPDLATA